MIIKCPNWICCQFIDNKSKLQIHYKKCIALKCTANHPIGKCLIINDEKKQENIVIKLNDDWSYDDFCKLIINEMKYYFNIFQTNLLLFSHHCVENYGVNDE